MPVNIVKICLTNYLSYYFRDTFESFLNEMIMEKIPKTSE